VTRHIVGADRPRDVELPEVVPCRDVTVRTVHDCIPIADPTRSVTGGCADVFEVAAWIATQQIPIEAVAPDLLHRATGQHVGHPGVVGGVMVDGLSEWDRLIRSRHAEQRRKPGLPLILADLPVHLYRSLVGEHEDFCFWNHCDSLST
jgi:hypothetical protein